MLSIDRVHCRWAFLKFIEGMVSLVSQSNSSAGETYYSIHLSRDDYHAKEGLIAGEWYGKAAEQMGLSGELRPEDYKAVLHNRYPSCHKLAGERITVRKRTTQYYDLTFNMPKDVSLVAMRDERVKTIVLESVREQLALVEQSTETRVRAGQQVQTDATRKTGNLAACLFLHEGSRTHDPQLHVHVVIHNLTFDPVEKRFKAIQELPYYRQQKLFDMAVLNDVAGKLRQHGYEIENTRDAFRIAGISEELRQKFSKRSAEMDERLLTLRQKHPDMPEVELRQQAALLTRKSKEHLSPAEFHRRFEAQLTNEEKDQLNGVIQQAAARKVTPPALTEREALRLAMVDCFERASVVTENQLLAKTLHYGRGQVDIQKIQNLIRVEPFLREIKSGEVFLTTPEVRQQEKAIIDFVREGRGECPALGQSRTELAGLSEEQFAAVDHILRSHDRVIGIRGRAGTGKTTLMRETVAAIEKNGHQVFLFAPSADASRGVLRREGFSQADTVTHLLKNELLHPKIKGQVLWIDEAGLLSVPEMHRVIALAQRQNCRVILSGDYRQHASVQRGDAFRILVEHAGMKPVELKQIWRQKVREYRRVVEDLSEGKIPEAFSQLDKMGVIREFTGQSRYDLLAADYVQAVREHKSALVISPTHAESEKVTETIRATLQKQSFLVGEEKEFIALRSVDLKEAQKRLPSSYSVGQVIQFEQNTKGFDRGEQVAVVAIEKEKVWVEKIDGVRLTLQLHHSDRFQVYEKRALPMAIGDRVRITHNSFDETRQHRLDNGFLAQVTGFKKGKIVLDEKWVLPRNFRHLTHGYCVTSHASQGKTVDRVLIAENAWSAKVSGSMEQFYVSISRGRESVRIYTDDKAALLEAVKRSRARISAHDLKLKIHQKIQGRIRYRYGLQLKQIRQTIKQTLKGIRYGHHAKETHGEHISNSRGIRM